MRERLRDRISRAGAGIASGIARLLGRGGELDPRSVEELETVLLSADVGVEATQQIMAAVARVRPRGTGGVVTSVREEMIRILAPCAQPLSLPPRGHGPFVILVVGVNGAGKTTTIGKMACRFLSEGRSVLLAAGDTFRAAAVEQLVAWGKRLQIPVISQHPGADAASVIFDAYSAARARGLDILIADTAGRLHTQENLMAELAKVRRVLAKQDAAAPHETMLVLDATMGQNAVSQARSFGGVVGVTSIVLTKLDGTAKGGMIFAVAKALKLPVRFIGVGEEENDLQTFVAEQFVDALLGDVATAPGAPVS